MVRNAILGFILFFVFGLNLQAQKLGYVNVEALKSEMPEIASAESELKLYKMMLFEQGMIMVKALQKEYNIIQRRVSGSCLSPRDYQKMLVRIKIMTYELESFEASIPDRIQSLEAKLKNWVI